MNLGQFVVGTALAALVGFTSPASAQTSGEPVRLPFASAFSGPLVDFGERLWNEGVLPTVAEINKSGGINGRPLEFYKVDTRFPDSAAWLTDFRRICADKNVPLMFGVGATKQTVAIYEEIKKCGLPLFNPSSTGKWPAPDFAGWIFRYQPEPTNVMPVLFKRLQEKLGIKRVAISYTLDDDQPLNNFKVVKQVLNDLKIPIVSEQSFRTGETNLTAQVEAIRAARPDVVVLLHQPADMGSMALQLRDRGVKAQLVSDANIGGADFWRLSKGEAKGTIGYAIYAADDPRPIVQDWLKIWRAATKKSEGAPDGFVTSHYDGVRVLAHILKSSPHTREGLKDGFLKIKDLETVSGRVSWNEVGDVTRSEPVLVQVGDNGVLQTWK